MVALQALRETVRALADSPVLLLGGLVYALVVAPQTALAIAGVPLLPTIVQILTFFVTPFVLAGVVGLAAAALDGGARFETFVDVGKRRYLPLLVGNLLEFGITFLIGVVVLVVGIVLLLVVGVGAFALGGGSGGGPGLGAVALVAVVALPLAALVAAVFLFVQFYPIAIVYDGADSVEGFRRSYRLVRENLVPALGYSVVVLLAGLVATVPVVAVAFLLAAPRLRTLAAGGPVDPGGGAGPGGPGATPVGPGTTTGGALADGSIGGLFALPEVLGLTLLSVVLTTVLVAFRQTYATAFYRAAVGRRVP